MIRIRFGIKFLDKEMMTLLASITHTDITHHQSGFELNRNCQCRTNSENLNGNGVVVIQWIGQ